MTIKDLMVWPPGGFTNQVVLTFDEAMYLICCGAVLFRSVSVPAHHAAHHHAHFHSFLELSNGHRIREASFPLAMLDDYMSFPLDEALDEPAPWNTLEQPSMTLCFGRYPGTMTFTRYVSRLNRPAASLKCASMILLRELGVSRIFDRLRYLQDKRNYAVASEEERNFLYGELLMDPESDIRNGNTVRDIDVLSDLLSSEIWIDFSDPGEQIVAQYHVNGRCGASAELFFHQLLLSTELARRIDLCATYAGHSSGHLLSALPRRVAWGVRMSVRFFQNLAFEEVQQTDPTNGRSYSLVPQNKYAQIETVMDVGYSLKWPTMPQIEAKMMAESAGQAIQCLQWTMPSVTFLTGIVMPGPMASWMVLSCLLDCDHEDRTALYGLKELRPQSGFQYLFNTYWYWESMVGKVLGAMQGSKCVAGWIGPCISTPDLERVEYVRIHHERAPERIRETHVKTVAARSEPLGTLNGSYPVSNFHLPLPYSSTVDCIRVEKLALVPLYNLSGCDGPQNVEHKIAVQFAVNGRSIPVRLRYDVSFIAAAACSAGPHVLFYNYTYKQIQIDQLLYITEWAERFAKNPIGEGVSSDEENDSDIDKVLVIMAYGAADNAVLARAWCVHLGLSAVVADINRTCLACTIREAYAARVAVAIISDFKQVDDEEQVPRASASFAKR
ncbi:MAG: hypothetical protein LQ341_000092 [Variospora aurantia]|nr:MAG: hypothetical protein LQ341_000092 [Variospora aurantia]